MYRVFCVVLFVFTVSLGFSQDNSDFEFSSLAIGTDYSTNSTLNGGVSMFDSQPTMSTYANFYHKSGFDFAFIMSNIQNSDELRTSSTQEYGLSLGYEQSLTKWLDLYGSYSYYMYSRNSYSLRSSYQHLYNLNLYSTVDWWFTSIDAGYYSGRAEDFFMSFETGVEFEFDDVFKKGNTLSFQPSISVYAGSVGYYNEEAYRNYYFIYNFSERNPDITVAELKEIYRNPVTPKEKNIQYILVNRPRARDRIFALPDDLVIWDLFQEYNRFDINSIGFSLPIYYTWGDFMINAGFSMLKPANQESYFDDSWQSYTNVGLTYFFTW
jgi:hypothetical protein